MTCEISTRAWRDGTLTEHDFPLADLSDHLCDPNTLSWADLLDPEPADLQQLAEELELDPHSVEDALTMHERPKAVRYDSHIFITAFTVTGMADEGDMHRISIFVMPHAVVTVRLGAGFPIDDVAQDLQDNTELLKHGPKALLHALLDTIVDGYYEVVTRIDERVDDLEEELFDEQHAGNRIARQIYELHKEISHLRRMVLPMRDVVSMVLRRASDPGAERDLVAYYEDLYDHTMRVAEWTDSIRDTIGSIRDTNLALVDTAMNTVMKKLTSWAAIIAVPTAITGWYGQNVPYPGFSKQWGFYCSVGLIVAIALFLYASFKRRNWL